MCTFEKNSPIVYSGACFSEVYKHNIVVPFQHKPFVEGPVNQASLSKIAQAFNQAVVSVPGVIFAPDQSVARLTGGSCSELSLIVAEYAAEKMHNLGHDGYDEVLFISQMKAKIELLQTSKPAIRKEIRTTQAVFNGIQVKRECVSDPSLYKMQALARTHRLQVLSHSEETQDINEGSLEKIQAMISQLYFGVHIMRVIEKDENSPKLETQGHTTLFFKLPSGKEFYFDCNLGMYGVENDGPNGSVILASIKAAAEKHHINACRIYTVQPIGSRA